MILFTGKQEDYDLILGEVGKTNNLVAARCACMCSCANCGRCGCSCICTGGNCNCRYRPESGDWGYSDEILNGFFAF